jgi:gamma-butyrobetaine dioxygenase
MKPTTSPAAGVDALGSLDELLALLRSSAGLRCDGEPVTQLEHALQCAALAMQSGADDALIAAALLHDVGHLQPLRHPSVTGEDDHHNVGARQLGRLFGPAVTEPIRLHVAAKRFLVATAADYAGLLSEESQRSLQTQGGSMNAAECEVFAVQPFAADAVRLRRWDDLAKSPDAPRQRLERFVPLLLAAARPQSLSND